MIRIFREPVSWTRAASAVLVLVFLLICGIPVSADDSSPESTPPGSVAEPFFSFLLSAMERDALGTWSGEDVASWGNAQGHTSRMPLEEIVELRRRRPYPVEIRRWPEAELRAMWEMTLTDDLQVSMPYSIMGYHPGSLRIAGKLVLSELALGDRTFLTEEEDSEVEHALTDIRGIRLDAGYVVLDADRIPDMLLGDNLDDAWTLGFVAAYEDSTRVGLTVAVKRDGHPIFGQFDFRNDRIMRSGSPLGVLLSRWCRGWFRHPDSSPPAFWTGEEK